MVQPTKKASKVEVPSEDPEPKDGDEGLKDLQEKSEKHETNTKPEDEDDEDALSPEDQKLKEDLETLVDSICNTSKKTTAGVRKNALDSLKMEIRNSTSSMTSVPKPLKFLKPHYNTLKESYEGLPSHSTNKKYLAEILSVLAMTMAEEGSRDSLAFKLAGNAKSEPGEWGHNYVSHLAGEIGTEYHARVEAKTPTDDLFKLVEQVIPFCIQHHSEAEAVDLLIEVDRFALIKNFISADNYQRVCMYLASCSEFASDVEEREAMLRTVYECYFSQKDLPNALRFALKLGDRKLPSVLMAAAGEMDPLLQKQLGFMLGAQSGFLEEYEDDDDIMAVMGNQLLSEHFKNLARELDVQEPKLPEDIYKTHLAEGATTLRRGADASAQKTDSAKKNLADTFVNAFVNVGFGTDKLMMPEGSEWLYKNKDHGMFCAAASVGALLLWDVDTGFSAIDKYSYSQQVHVKAGSLLGTGIVSCGVRSEMDAALCLLAEHVDHKEPAMKIAAALGLGLAYAGTRSEEVLELLVPMLVDPEQPMEVSSYAALALGMVFVGSAGTTKGDDEEDDEDDGDVTETIIEAIMERTDTDMANSVARLMGVGLGLFYLGREDACEPALAVLGTLEFPIAKYLAVTVETCAYFGTGNVLQIQKLLSIVGEHILPEEELSEEEKKEKAEAEAKAAAEKGDDDDDDDAPKKNTTNTHQAIAVVGIAMVSMGEPLAAQMALRSLDHVLQYGEVNVRRAIPIALGLLSISNPDLAVMDTLSKLTHDSDQEVSQNACLALGLIGAGTNNSRIANLLRNLAVYYAKEPNHLFLVRIAQGLLHMGKGLMTLSPFQSDNLLLSKVSSAALVAFMHTALDLKNSILGQRSYLLYLLMPAVRPRFLFTLDENLEPIAVKVRVGQAVDVVGVAGKPRSITGFQTHTTPVLLSAGERAELASDEFVSLTPILEGFVIVKKNPDAEE